MSQLPCKRFWEGPVGITLKPQKQHSGEYFWTFSFTRAFKPKLFMKGTSRRPLPVDVSARQKLPLPSGCPAGSDRGLERKECEEQG
jgi:hypothetical protein